MVWQLQEAKNKFSQVVDNSLSEGPQIITRHGKNTAVLMDYRDYEKIIQPRPTFKDIINDFRELEFPDIEREKDPTGRANPFSFDD